MNIIFYFYLHLGLCSFGLTIGPPIAGEIYDNTQSYTLPFVLAGIPPIIGALLMFLIRFVKEDQKVKAKNELREAQPLQPLPQMAWEEKGMNDSNFIVYFAHLLKNLSSD